MKQENIYRELYKKGCVFIPQPKKVTPPKVITAKVLIFEKKLLF